jgi:hypothetical protein
MSILTQLLRKFSACYGNRRVITVFGRVCQRPLSSSHPRTPYNPDIGLKEYEKYCGWNGLSEKQHHRPMRHTGLTTVAVREVPVADPGEMLENSECRVRKSIK